MQLEHLVRRVPARKTEELREIAERGARSVRSGPCSRDLRRTAARAHEADENLDERGLPGAVRAEQPDELALADLEVDAFQRVHGAEALAEVADSKRARHGRQSTLRPCHAATWKGPHRRRRSAAQRSSSAVWFTKRRRPPTRRSTAAPPTIPSRTSSAGSTRSTPTSCSSRARPGASRSDASPSTDFQMGRLPICCQAV